MVYVTFLGTGAALSAGPRGNLLLLIESGGFRMMLESGPLVIQQLASVGLGALDIEHMFVSHSHGDHTLGFPMLALHRRNHHKLLHVYGGSSTLDTLRILCAASYSGLQLLRANTYWHPLSEDGRDRTFIQEGVTMTTDVVSHAPGTPTLAARWDFEGGPSVTFATDTIPTSAAVNLARGSNLLIHDSNYSAILQPNIDPARTYHSTARQAGEIARQASCPHLALVHLSSEVAGSADLLAAEARAGTELRVTVPNDGERIAVL